MYAIIFVAFSDNRQISREPRYGLAEDRSSLSIHEARKDDAGLYTCFAKGYGAKNASRSVMVTVVCELNFERIRSAYSTDHV